MKYKTIYHWNPVSKTLRSYSKSFEKINQSDCYSLRKVHQEVLPKNAEGYRSAGLKSDALSEKSR